MSDLFVSMRAVKRLVVLCLGLAGFAAPVWAITDTQLFGWAAASYPAYFAGAVTEGTYQQYHYRIYAATGNALAVDTLGGVFVLGPVTGNTLLPVGSTSQYEAAVNVWDAAQRARGNLLANSPSRSFSFTAASLKTRLNGSTKDKALLVLSGDPVCGVDVFAMGYKTVGGLQEATTATAALMTPTGSDPKCTGPRPVVLYAHGTSPAKAFNLAALAFGGNPGYAEGLLVAAFYAAQGYVVVAPNYAGYDASSLPYHPFLVAQQQANDMIDALTAARIALPLLDTPVPVSGKLFLTGYSQGGHVAMATQRALQQQGVLVTASAPLSGPYAVGASLDDVFIGRVSVGATLFGTLLSTAYQRVYGTIYANPAQWFESAFASGIDSLLPGADVDVLIATKKLPEFALISAGLPQAPVGSPLQRLLLANTPPSGTPRDKVYSRGFGPGNLITNAARAVFLQDVLNRPDGALNALAPWPGVVTTGPRMPAVLAQNPMRAAAALNDLRGWSPQSPTLLCAGNEDPTVSYLLNSKLMADLWVGLPAGTVTLLDVDSRSTGSNDPFQAEKRGFALVKTAAIIDAQFSGKDPDIELANGYHGALVPFCFSAARTFFERFKQ